MSKIIYGVMGVFVVVILLGSIVMPAIDEATSDGGGGTVIVNEGAGWLRLGYNTGGSIDLSYSVTDSVTATNGSDVQTGSFGDMVLFASDTATIYIDDGDVVVFTKDAQDNVTVGYLDDNFTVISDESSLTIDDAGSQYVCELPTWYYTPMTGGNYATFDDAGFTVPADYSPIAISESFAGVIGIGDTLSFDVPLVYDLQKEGDIITGASWTRQSDSDVTPDDLSIVPLDPSVIQIDPIDLGDDENVIMTVPTPTYTDGYWGYDLSSGKATIVSYSGPGGGPITIPATVGGYDVITVGKGGSNQSVFQTTLAATDLIISPGITTINNQAFRSCSGFTGNLVIPDSVTSVGSSCFNSCSGFTGSIFIPESLTTVSTGAFKNMSGIDYLICCGSPTIDQTPFEDTLITEIMNFGETVLSGGSYGLPADVTIRSGDDAQLEALMYLSAATISEGGTGNHNPANDILKMLPIIVIASVLIAIVGIIAYRGKQ